MIYEKPVLCIQLVDSLMLHMALLLQNLIVNITEFGYHLFQKMIILYIR